MNDVIYGVGGCNTDATITTGNEGAQESAAADAGKKTQV